MSVQNIAFRTDATGQIGTGHFMRCLTLADALKQRGAHVCFISRDLPVHLRDMLAAKDMVLVMLGSNADSLFVGDLAHAHWLGASQEQDAQATVQALSDRSWDWLVVDHYALDARWERALRGNVRQIMVIDDIADRQHDCDVLLDQNYYADMQTRYTGKVPEHCKLLLGPRYALLRDEFRKLREQVKQRNGTVKKILVFFGGVDADNYTGRAIEALVEIGIEGLHVDVVIGAQHPCREQIKAVCAQHGFICHVQTDKMAELMAAADLAIGAGGSASWERCCLGLPSLLVAMADNQVDIAKALDLSGACIYMGTLEAATASTMRSAITDLLNKYNHLEIVSRRASSLVDGMGVNRVCQNMGC
jgi:UDP-2,4-diacetamido-2,4,6-trideoxy-beta-L-altropyranose hydrolase